MKKIYLLMWIILCISASCAYEEHLVVNDNDGPSAKEELIIDGKVSLSRAMSNADFVFKNIDATAAKNRKVKRIDVLTRRNSNSNLVSTRTSSLSNEDQPLAYVVNYENNEGFAILAADTKLPPVISVGDEGNFDTESFVSFIQGRGITRAEDELTSAQKVQYAVINNSLALQQANITGPQIQGVDTTVIFKCLPLVKTKWGQGNPYNFYSPLIMKGGFLVKQTAGSIPVAGAQTLASLCYHHNWRPTVQLSEVYNINWYAINKMIFEDINKFTSGDQSSNALVVASLIQAIKENIGFEQTGLLDEIDLLSLVNVYQQLGIISPVCGNENSETPVTRNDIFNMIISKNYPVNAKAFDDNANEHWSFILDGWLRLEYSVLSFEIQEFATITDNIQYRFDLVHVNFGLEGLCDGYYLPDAFDLTQDKYSEYTEENDIDYDGNRVYDLNVEYLKYDYLQ